MINPKAQAAKDRGNVAFKLGDYPLAIGHYTSAIMADARDPTYPLNRAAAYLKLGKNEDAERDCNTVLNLNANNVKALFRRGQARVEMGKILEAQKDFSDVLRIEPANTSAQEELKKVAALVQNEKAKKAKAPIAPVQASLDPALNTKRRRVPIKIIDASGAVLSFPSQETTPAASTSTKAQPQPAISSASMQPIVITTSPVPKTKPAPAAMPKSDTLEPISSRSLKSSPAGSSDTPPVPVAFSAAAAALQPEEKEPTKGQGKENDTNKGASKPKPAPASFQQAKLARENVRPSRVGGGIFRSSGQNTVFASRGGKEGATKSGIEELVEVKSSSASASSAPATVTHPATISPVPKPTLNFASSTLPKAPTTYFDFNRAWHSFRSPEERWALINAIPPAQLPTLCQTSLEPALLISILDVFLTLLNVHSDNASLKQRVLEYMQNLARIPRFGTLVLFLSKPEKEVAKGVWALLGVEPAGTWRAVGY